MSDFKWLKNIIKEAISVEGNSKIGRLNLKWLVFSFILSLIVLINGCSFKVSFNVNKDGHGGDLNLEQGTIWDNLIPLAIVFFSGLLCISLVLYAKSKNWINNDDY